MSFSGRENYYLDDYDQVVHIPNRDDVAGYRSTEEQMRILDKLESPNERLKTLFKSFINVRAEPTHEAYYLREIAMVGFNVGLIYGGIIKSRNFFEEYQRKHNASVFDNKYVGNRHFWDTLILNIGARGFKYGIRCLILSTSAGFITFGSITYRNQLYLPDFLIGFTTLGGLSRLWLGSRAVAIGAGVGLIGGLIGFGVGKSYELLSGYSITQNRLIEHQNWLARREAKLRKIQLLAQEDFKKLVGRGDMK